MDDRKNGILTRKRDDALLSFTAVVKATRIGLRQRTSGTNMTCDDNGDEGTWRQLRDAEGIGALQRSALQLVRGCNLV